jgi:hypothetical protein
MLMYSLHGFEPLIRPLCGEVCQSLIVVSNRFEHRAADPRGQAPVLVGLGLLHELVGHAHRVVGVLELDRLPSLPIEAHVVAGLAKRPGLLLFLGLAPDEFVDVRVVRVEDDHLRRAPSGAAGLDRTSDRIGAAHEGHGSGREAATGEVFFLRTDPRYVHPRAGAALEDDPLIAEPVEDRVHVVFDREDEARARLLGHTLDADVEPHRRVEGSVLMDHEVLQLVGERVAVGGAREVAALEAGASDGVDDAVDHLSNARLAFGRSELAAEVLRGDDVRRGLRPELGDLDALLLEDVPVLAGNGRVAELPLDLVVRVDALAGEEAVDPEPFGLGAVNGFLRDVGDCHVRAPLESREV